MKINKHLDYQKEVWATDTITGIEKLVLLAIADHFNWTNKQEAYPSNELLTQKTMLGIRTVIRAKNALVKKGWLISERRFNKSNFYTPTIPSDTMSHDTMSLPISQSEISHNETSNSATLAPLESDSATQTPQGCHSDMSGGVTEYKLIDNGIDYLIDNNSSFAAWESEVISQEEENSFSDVIEEKELLETRGTSIPLDNLLNISKYLDSNLSLSDIKEEVNDKDTFFLIVKERKSRGIF
jgi:hypothetical protein